MKRRLIAVLLMFLLATPIAAQEWAVDALGGMEYNCFLLDHINGDFGDADYLTREGAEVSVEDMLLQLASGCKTTPETDTDLAYLELIRSWPFIYQDENAYECETVYDIIGAYGRYDFQRTENSSYSVFDYHQKKAPYCLPRYVIAAKDLQLRGCLDGPCETNQYMLRGEALPVVDRVVADDETWYEVAREFKHYLEVEADDATAFVPAADIMLGPAGFVELDASYYILHENYTPHCRVFPLLDADTVLLITAIRAGGAFEEMQVDVYKPFADSPLAIRDQLEKEFGDSGKPFIHQVYDWSDHGNKVGIYTYELSLDGITYQFALNVQQMGVYAVHFYCK